LKPVATILHVNEYHQTMCTLVLLNNWMIFV